MDFGDKLIHAWHILGMLVVIAVLSLVITAISKTHKVDGYYIEKRGDDPSICVMTHWTWEADGKAFCTDDYQKALDFASKANSLVK